MRPKNPVASTAVKITTAMIFFMALFRKALKPDVRDPRNLLSTKKPQSVLTFFATFRQERQRFEKAGSRGNSHIRALNHNFALAPNFVIHGCRVLEEVPVSKEPIFAGFDAVEIFMLAASVVVIAAIAFVSL